MNFCFLAKNPLKGFVSNSKVEVEVVWGGGGGGA